jgi:hypothetical protein
VEHSGEIEKRLWSSADTLRANSNFASNEYFLPVMGLIFLRHAYSRFLSAKTEIEPTLPKRGGQTRALTKEDFSGRGAIFLQPTAQFDRVAWIGPDQTRQSQRAMIIATNVCSILIILDDIKGWHLNREVERLYDAGFFEGIVGETIQRQYKLIIVAVKDLSMKGHDFLSFNSRSRRATRIASPSPIAA